MKHFCMREAGVAALLSGALAFSSSATADSMLRVACDGADAKAEVSINGVFKGECPIDLMVGAGTIKLRAAKKVDDTRERVYEEEFRLGDGVAKRIEVTLGQPRLNPQAQRQAEAGAAQNIKEAEAGNPNAMARLGDRYFYGNGVAQDELKAAYWFGKAAEAGDVNGMDNIAYMLAAGRGVAKNDAQALAWYRKSAELGSAYAMHALGLRYASGSGGVARDDAVAADWYRKAADKGTVGSMINLGQLYQAGRGVPKDNAEAVKWYRMAADKGAEAGMHSLALMYAAGTGIDKDDAQAVTWFRKAADKGYANAIAELKRRGLR